MRKIYLCVSWQGLIQQIISLVTKGYDEYQLLNPKGNVTEERLRRIDKRIIKVFNLKGQTRNTRYTNKKRGIANFIYLRWDKIAIILKTKGEVPESLKNEKFSDTAKGIIIEVSDIISIKIGYAKGEAGRYTCRIEKHSYNEILGDLLILLEHKKINELQYMFSILNNLPAYKGVIEQKFEIRKTILKNAKKHNIKLDMKSFFVLTRRKMYKVFK